MAWAYLQLRALWPLLVAAAAGLVLAVLLPRELLPWYLALLCATWFVLLAKIELRIRRQRGPR